MTSVSLTGWTYTDFAFAKVINIYKGFSVHSWPYRFD